MNEKIDLNIYVFAIWHFDFLWSASFPLYLMHQFSMRSFDLKNCMSNVVQKQTYYSLNTVFLFCKIENRGSHIRLENTSASIRCSHSGTLTWLLRSLWLCALCLHSRSLCSLRLCASHSHSWSLRSLNFALRAHILSCFAPSGFVLRIRILGHFAPST